MGNLQNSRPGTAPWTGFYARTPARSGDDLMNTLSSWPASGRLGRRLEVRELEPEHPIDRAAKPAKPAGR